MTDRIEKLKALLEDEPDDTFALYGLAMEYAKIGDHQAAVDYFDRTIEADPAYAYAYYHKAKSLDELDEQQRAIQTLQIGLAQAREADDEKAAGELQELLEDMQ